jgi:pimeloyl-ACP methyl ester carboxylesterase
VPDDPARYSQNRATGDIASVLDHLKIDRAHVVGLSMGGFATLHFGFRYALRALSLTVAGCGYGAEKGQEERFRKEVEAGVAALRTEGMAAFAEKFAYSPPFEQLRNKDPRGFAQFKRELAEHSAIGSANTRRGVQGHRPSLYDLVGKGLACNPPC